MIENESNVLDRPRGGLNDLEDIGSLVYERTTLNYPFAVSIVIADGHVRNSIMILRIYDNGPCENEACIQCNVFDQQDLLISKGR